MSVRFWSNWERVKLKWHARDNPFVMFLSFIPLLLIWVVGWVTGSMGGRLGVTWILFFFFFFIGGENAQLTKDKKWTVNTLNKAQQTYKNKLTLSLSLPPPLLTTPPSNPPPPSCTLTLSSTPLTKGRLRAYKVPINTECLPLAPPSLNCWQLWCLG